MENIPTLVNSISHQTYGITFRVEGDYEQALQVHQEAVDILRSLNAQQTLVWALTTFGLALFNKGDFQQARVIVQEAFELAEAIEDYKGISQPLSILGFIERMEGHYRETERLVKLSAELFRQHGNQVDYIHRTGYVGEIVQLRGEYKQAQQILKETLPLAIEAGFKWAIGQQYEFIGHIEHALGNYTLAEENLLESLRIAHEHGDPRRIIFSQVGLGDLYIGTSNFDEAQKVYQEAINRAKPSSQRWQETWALRGLAQTAYGTGDYQGAIQYSDESLQLCHTIGWKYGKVQNYNIRALVAIAEQNPSEAGHYILKSLDSGLVNETPPLILATLYGTSRLFSHEGNLERAVELLGLILSHPKSHADTKHITQDLLDELEAELAEDVFASAVVRGQSSDLENVVSNLIDELAEQVVQAPPIAMETLDEALTATELEILRLMVSDLSYPEIAEARAVSLNTIKTHRSNIYSKLGVNSREDAVARAKDLTLL